MTELLRVKLRWSGFVGAPGFSVFHFRDYNVGGDGNPITQESAAAAAGRVRNFFNGTKFLFPNTVTFHVENDVEVIEDTTGEITGFLSAGNPADVIGEAGVNVGYSAAVGAVINWRTNAVRRGRRVRGRTFLVPLSSSCYENNGSLNASCLTALNTAAAGLTTTTAQEPELGVYARPHRTRNTDGSWTTVPDGEWSFATSFNVPDMTAVLRSRRD
jgi:hypothetical protein